MGRLAGALRRLGVSSREAPFLHGWRRTQEKRCSPIPGLLRPFLSFGPKLLHFPVHFVKGALLQTSGPIQQIDNVGILVLDWLVGPSELFGQ